MSNETTTLMKKSANFLVNVLLALPVSFLFNILLMRLHCDYWQVIDWHPARCFVDVFYPSVSIDGETSYDVQLFDDLIVANGIFMTVAVFGIILWTTLKARTPHA